MSQTQEQDEEEPGGHQRIVQHVRGLRVLAVSLLYITCSGCMIKFNQFLMTKGRFPHALPLTTVHMLVGTVLSSLLYSVAPSLFPGMAKVKGRRRELVYSLVPVGVCFAVSIYAGNVAYSYSTVPFLQFMKESNVLLTFLISCAVGLQVMSRSRFAVIVWVVAGSSMCLASEAHFVFFGFLFQLLSQLADCLKAVLSEYLLTKDTSLDSLTFTLFVAPLCLAVLLMGNTFTFNRAVLADLQVWWPLIIPNALLAFALNLTNFLVLRETSAVGLIITGMCKDMSLVVVSSMLCGDEIAKMQWLSFCVTLSGVGFWSLMKVEPDSPIVVGFERILGSRPAPILRWKVDERSRLIAEKPV